MLLPEVWELFGYWREHPPTHIILAAVHRKSDDHEEPTGTEVGMLNYQARKEGVKSSATLPLAVQAAFQQMRNTNG